MKNELARMTIASSLPHVLLLVSAATLCFPAPAEAKKKKEKPAPSLSESEQETFDTFVAAAREAIDEGRYDKAMRALNAAYSIDPRPELLYGLGLSYEELKRYDEAVDHYNRFLEALPEAPNREEVEAKLKQLPLRASTRLVVRVTPQDASIFLDGEPLGQAPLDQVVEADVPIEVRAEAPGHLSETHTVAVALGAEERLTLTLKPEPVEEEPGLSSRQRGGIAAMLGGGVLILGGAGLAWSGERRRDALLALDRAGPRPADYDDSFLAANRRSTIGLVAIGVGAAATGLGAWFAFASPERAETAPAARRRGPTLHLSPRQVQLRLEF